MTILKSVKKKYNIGYLNALYHSKIAHRAHTGIDNVHKAIFEKNIEYNLLEIADSVMSCEYRYIPYKEKLISKGRGKEPRVISIPCIKDKVTLSALNEILMETYSEKIVTPLTQVVIGELKKSINSNDYDYFVKIDITSFYDNIDHNILMKKLKKRVKRKEMIDLIEKAIKNPTIIAGSKRNLMRIGVPQGISISNILASIYLLDVDRKMNNKKNIKYFRYVDDILILCKEKDKDKITELIQTEFTSKLKLSINDKKSEGSLTKQFDYLGYHYKEIKKNEKIYGFSVKDKNRLKLEDSIIQIFKQYNRDKNVYAFIWKLNLRITGFILEKNKYGWLFFYSQIDDETILHKLDWFIHQKLCDKYNIDLSIRKRIKKFVTAYFEITKKRGQSTYISRAESYSIQEKKRILLEIFEFKVATLDLMNEEQIRAAFKNKMSIYIKDLEKDVQSIS